MLSYVTSLVFDVFRGSYKDLDKNVFMVFVVEYVIIVFRSLKPRDSNPVSSPTARPDSRV